jgi:PKD repeat protein
MIPRYPDCQLIEKISYCYEITEEGAARLDTLPFVYEWDLGDGTKKRGIRVEHCYENPGLYMVQLNVIDSLTREVKYNEAAYPIQVDKVEQVMFNSLDTCYVGDEVEFDGSETSFTSFEIAEYQWNFNDGNVGVSTIVSNLFLAPGIYNVQLKVISMPDQDGQIRTECGCKNIVVLEKPPI